MRRIGALLSVWIVAIACAQARLTETISACAKRYGQPVDKQLDWDNGSSGRCIYQPGGYRIEIRFIQGTAREIIFHRADGENITREEFLTLLANNVGDSVWEEANLQTLNTKDRSRRAHLVGETVIIKLVESEPKLETLESEFYQARQRQQGAALREEELTELHERLTKLEGF